MGFLRSRFDRRFPALGLASDLALVGAAASRMFRRRRGSAGARTASGAELAMAGGAALRLLRRWRRRRQAKRLRRTVAQPAP